MRLTKKQKAVQKLRDAFNDVIEFAKAGEFCNDEFDLDADKFEEAKQEIIGVIIDNCPAADPGTFIELADGRWTLLENIRNNPGAYVQLSDGRWAASDSANVTKLADQ